MTKRNAQVQIGSLAVMVSVALFHAATHVGRGRYGAYTFAVILAAIVFWKLWLYRQRFSE